MLVKQFSDKILLSSLDSVLKLHLYLKMTQHNIRFYRKDIDIIVELYKFGGYSNLDEQSDFMKLCIDKGYKKSVQSIRNTFSKYITLGVLLKPKNCTLKVSDSYIPKVEFDKLVLQYIISHAD
jgi:dimeric dUTPase (all-alpha-NTP-PPase superfamily)